MERDLLQRVIDTERDISKSVASEKEKAAALLASVQQTGMDRLAEERQRSEQLFHQAMEQFVLRKKQEVEDNIKRIENETAALDRFPEQMIRRIILKHLQKILPGERHDRQDVEN